MPTLWQNLDDLPTIRKIEQEFGEDKTLGLIAIKVNNMLDGLPQQLDKMAMKKLTHFIKMQYQHLRFAEFDIIGMNLMREELFGKINLNTVVRAIDSYWNERANYAAEAEIKEASEQKGTIAHVSLLKTFNEAMELRKQKKEMGKQAERARIAEIRRINDEKATKLKREFANDYKPA